MKGFNLLFQKKVLWVSVLLFIFIVGAVVPIQATPTESPMYTAKGPNLAVDLWPGVNGSSPNYLTVYNDKLFFQADDGSGIGGELWASNGTTAGTHLVKDIRSGIGSFPASFANYNGKLYFQANDGSIGYELWESNGTGVGTKLVKDINIIGGSDPWDLTVFNGKLYFSAFEGTNGRELWESDGTGTNTKISANISPAAGNSDPVYLTVFKNKLYFVADDGINGRELWVTDGTPAGTHIFVDILTGPSGSYPAYLTVLRDKMYFQANDSVFGGELWETDGTIAGTKIAVDINPGANGSYPGKIEVYNGRLYFEAMDANPIGVELWVSDGTPPGTMLLKDVNPGSNCSHPEQLTVYNGLLYFQAGYHDTYGSELWVTDGTTSGTKMVADIVTGVGSSNPSNLTILNGKLYFQAQDPAHGKELWVYETSTIFTDGFESGDTSAWSSSTGAFEDGDYADEGKCKLCVDTAYALVDNFGLKVRLPNKKPHYLTDTTPNSESRYRARFYIKAKGLKMAAGSKFKLFQGKMGKKQPFFLLVRKKGKKFQIRPYVRSDKGKNLKPKWTTLPKKPSYVEVDWMAAESTSKHNGYIKLYVNGNLKRTKGKVNNDKMVINEVRLGVTQKIAKTSTISGAFYLDAFASDWLDYLGP